MSDTDHPAGRHHTVRPDGPGPDGPDDPCPDGPDGSGLGRPDDLCPDGPDGPGTGEPSHPALTSLLGAWALAACSPEEAAVVEHHLGGCGACAEEAVLLREAVGLLHPAESLDLDPALRARVLQNSLARRSPRVPVPGWAGPYDAETARLDALLKDIGAAEWHAPVRLRWYADDRQVSRRTTVAAVLGHLLSVDGLVAVALGLDDPLGAGLPADLDAGRRTEAYWAAAHPPPTCAVRVPWREQSHRLVRTAARTAGDARSADGAGVAAAPVAYGDFTLPLCDALLERAFECWIHASDIAAAVDYPYGPPVPRHLHRIIDLTARRLPGALAALRRGGPSARAGRTAGPRRVLRLEVEGAGGGEWLIALDAPAAGADAGPGGTAAGRTGTYRTTGTAGRTGHGGHGGRSGHGGHGEFEVCDGSGVRDGREVAHVALDGFEFCRLAAGHVSPEEATAGSTGDRNALTAFLTATASLSRM